VGGWQKGARDYTDYFCLYKLVTGLLLVKTVSNVASVTTSKDRHRKWWQRRWRRSVDCHVPSIAHTHTHTKLERLHVKLGNQL
jgi:hypothetical protein